MNGVVIKAPDKYKPVFATTSTDDSDRSQDGEMHNTPMFTIAGYNLIWGELSWPEIANILGQCKGKKKFSMCHKDPSRVGWITEDFYASNFEMEAQTLEDDSEEWTGLTINVRRIHPDD